MKLNFIDKILIIINSILIFFQMLLMGTFGDFHYFPLLNILVPIFALVNLIFFIYWIFIFKWPFILFIASLFIAHSDWSLLYKFPSNSISVSNGLKIMSFNVRLFNSYNWIGSDDIPDEIESFILKEDPDILCFQEFSFEKSPKFLNYKYRYIQSLTENGENGLSILSKYPLYNRGLINFENSNNGGIYSDLKYKNDTIRIYNLHFESLHLSLNDSINNTRHSEKIKKRLDHVVKKIRQSKSRQQIEKIFNIQEKQVMKFNEIQEKNNYLSIVCTDLNNNAFSKPYSLLTLNYIDSFAQKGSGFGTTYEISSIPFRIDFILVDPRIEVIRFETYDLSLSDHRPISAVVKL
tara:strand:+ start:249 stop:1298 length:1050 start_codon:yes stop_codon:yes gene_type:complete